MGTPQEMANASAFLASPAASFIAGRNVVVDVALTQGVQLQSFGPAFTKNAARNF